MSRRGADRGRRVQQILRPIVVCLAVVVFGLVVAGGCGLRTPSGIRVDQRSVDTTADDPDIRKLPPGPAPGASPAQIVRGFLEAAAADTDHTFAEAFLAPGAVWSDRDAATIYAPDSLSALRVTTSGPISRVQLTAAGVGDISSGGSFTPDERPLTKSFDLRKVGDAWRLSHVPSGVLLAPRDLARVYRPVLAYGLNPSATTLVPEPGYVASDRAGLATAALHALLTDWGGDGLSTLATGHSLARGLTALGSVVVQDGEATVDLGREAFNIPQQQRSLVVSQIAATLGSVPGVFTVRVLVEERPYVAGAVAAAVPSSLAATANGPLLGTREAGQVLTANGAHATPLKWVVAQGAKAGTGTSQPGPLMFPTVSPSGGEFVALQDGPHGTAMLLSTLAGSGVQKAALSQSVTLKPVPGGEYLPPQWLDGDQILVASPGADPQLQVIDGKGEIATVASPGLRAVGPLTALAVSRDGTRAAAIAGPDGARRLYVGRVVQREGARHAESIGGWAAVPTGLVDVAAVSWSDDLSLAVLGRPASTAVQTPALRAETVALDVVSDPVPLAPLPADFAAPPAGLTGPGGDLPTATITTAPGKPVVIGAGGRAWVLDAGHWLPSASMLAPAYP